MPVLEPPRLRSRPVRPTLGSMRLIALPADDAASAAAVGVRAIIIIRSLP